MLPRAERRMAMALLRQYPVAGLETVARLAEAAETSGPTVLRLVTRLGYHGFPSFQQALLDARRTGQRHPSRSTRRLLWGQQSNEPAPSLPRASTHRCET